MESSSLHFYSKGLVANNKPIDTHEIKVIPIEIRFAAEEDIIDNPTEVDIDYDGNNGSDSLTLVTNRAITATWLKTNTNRITSPDVRRGDEVHIYRLGESDRYFWVDCNSTNVKRLETAMWAFSADPKNPIADDLSNAYILEISTHDKCITLTTSQANGEPYGYTLQLNTNEGSFHLEDTDDNCIYLNSAETVIGFINADKTETRLDKKNIHMVAPDSMYVTAENLIKFECTDFVLNASKSITFTTKTWTVTASDKIGFETTVWEVKASTSISFDTGSYTCNANTVVMKANMVTSNAATTIATGLLKCAALVVGAAGNEGGGSAVIDCPATFNQPVSFNAGADFSGGITADSINTGTINPDSHGHP